MKARGWFRIRMEGCHYVALCGRVELFNCLFITKQSTETDVISLQELCWRNWACSMYRWRQVLEYIAGVNGIRFYCLICLVFSNYVASQLASQLTSVTFADLNAKSSCMQHNVGWMSDWQGIARTELMQGLEARAGYLLAWGWCQVLVYVGGGKSVIAHQNGRGVEIVVRM